MKVSKQHKHKCSRIHLINLNTMVKVLVTLRNDKGKRDVQQLHFPNYRQFKTTLVTAEGIKKSVIPLLHYLELACKVLCKSDWFNHYRNK